MRREFVISLIGVHREDSPRDFKRICEKFVADLDLAGFSLVDGDCNWDGDPIAEADYEKCRLATPNLQVTPMSVNPEPEPRKITFLISKGARKMVEEKGLQAHLGEIAGSGRDGAIIVPDVEAFVASQEVGDPVDGSARAET